MATQTSVLIVGAGPTGLMLANQLARRGASPIVIERNDGPSLRTKALGVQARTLEIYRHLGIAERALELGKRATGATMWVSGRRAANVPLGDIGRELSAFPFLLILGQDDNERLLGEALAGHEIPVRWRTELVGLRQAADHVTATLRRSDGGEETVIADWVAGCDGAHSAVRHLCGIDFLGAPYEHVFYVADTVARGPMTPEQLNIFLWRGGFHLFFPMRGTDHWRVAGILPKSMRDRTDLTFDDVSPSIRSEVGGGLEFPECRWYATYRIHHRRAARFREGRCLLLGDAAHIHSPIGAQGMNTGLQDAYNLAWKLALVTSHQAGPSLLDSYAPEREPVADRLLRTTDRAFSVVVSERWFARAFRMLLLPRLLAFAMGRFASRQFAFRTISQIGIGYPASPLSRQEGPVPRGAPKPGDRFPWIRVRFPGEPVADDLFGRLDDTKFNVLVIGQVATEAAPKGVEDLVRFHAVELDGANRKELGRVGIHGPAVYVLRPDGHVGLAGLGFDVQALERYLSGAIGIRFIEPAMSGG